MARKKKKDTAVLCEICNLEVPKSTFFDHLKVVHASTASEYEQEYGDNYDERDILVEEEPTEIDDAVPGEIPHVSDFGSIEDSLVGGEREFWRDRNEYLITQYGVKDAHFREQILFLMLVNHRAQITYTQLTQTGRIDNKEAQELFAKQTKNSESIVKLLDSYVKMREKLEQLEDVASLHGETMDSMHTFVKEHIGEFTFACQSCGEIVNTEGLPHSLIAKGKDEKGENVYYYWNPELWYAFCDGIIPFHVIPFVLRTSPEAIFHTAVDRGVSHSFLECVKNDHRKNKDVYSETLEEEERKLKILRDRFFDAQNPGI